MSHKLKILLMKDHDFAAVLAARMLSSRYAERHVDSVPALDSLNFVFIF
jgi:hypothetical protein